MNRPQNLTNRLAIRLWPYFLFGCIVTFYWKNYYGHLVPGDSVSYLSIAGKYAQGKFSTAVNAYWSPMISWLIALMIKIGTAPLLAFHIIKIMSGLLVIYFSEKIIALYKWPLWANVPCQVTVTGWAAYFTLHYLSPDALMTALLVIYLYLVLSGKWLQKPFTTGVLGSALYFTKAFGFFFFAAHVLLYAVWRIIVHRKQSFPILKKLAFAFSIFLIISFLWMTVLHGRYKKFTISSAAAYNHGLMKYGDGSVQPSLHTGLLPLPDTTAYNSWEDITLVHLYETWVPWQSKESMQLQLKVIKHNAWFELRKIYGANVLAWPVLVAGFIFLMLYVRNRQLKKIPTSGDRLDAHIYSFVLLYCFGYAMAGVDERYLWIADIGLLFLLVNMGVRLSKKLMDSPIVFWLAAIGLVILCGKETIGKLHFFRNELASQLEEVKTLQQIIPRKSIVATHETNAINAMDYLGDWHNHGGLEGFGSVNEMKKGLQQFHIEWVLIPDSVVYKYEWLKAESDTMFEVTNWKVYRLTQAL